MHITQSADDINGNERTQHMSLIADQNNSTLMPWLHIKLESVAITNALQLEGHPVACQSIWAVLGQICTVRVYKLLTVSFQSKL